MCRWFIYKGKTISFEEILYNHKNSIIKQSFKKKYTPFLEDLNYRDHEINVDGFGIGWYVTNKKCIFYKETKTPWSDFNFRRLSRILKAKLIFAHVRAIKPFSEGLIHEFNCHPFNYKNLLFMHNGDFKNFLSYKKKVLYNINDNLLSFIKGTTDSEHLFYLIISKIKGSFDSKNIKNAIIDSINILNKISKETISFNIAITNGKFIIFTRYINNDEKPCSLYFKENKEHVLISSEPIDYDSEWTFIPKNSIGCYENKCVFIEQI